MDQAEKLRNIVKQNKMNDAEQEAIIRSITAKTGKGAPESGKKARVITVTSGKGGVGKSSVSINLAIQLKKKGQSVIIFDADFGLANIEVMFGAVPKYNLSDVIFHGKAIKDVIIDGPMGIGFISGGSGINGLGNMSRDQVMYLVEKMEELEAMTDILIIDTGAGISDSVIEFVLSSAEILLVTTPEPTSITDSYALLKTLNSRAGKEAENITVKLIANRITSMAEAKNLYSKLGIVVNKFLKLKLEYLGMVPWDNNMSRAIMQQKPVSIAYPDSEGSRALAKIADAMLGHKHTDQQENLEKKGIAAAVLKMFRNRKN